MLKNKFAPKLFTASVMRKKLIIMKDFKNKVSEKFTVPRKKDKFRRSMKLKQFKRTVSYTLQINATVYTMLLFINQSDTFRHFAPNYTLYIVPLYTYIVPFIYIQTERHKYINHVHRTTEVHEKC